MAAAMVSQTDASGPFHLLTGLTFLCGWFGGMAPDWLEVAWWRRGHRLWIAHRTATHRGELWIGMAVYAYHQLGYYLWAGPLWGFACGGLIHLIIDTPNPLGVPWITSRRFSLNLWKSGENDGLLIAASWLAAIWVCDKVLFDGVSSFYLRLVIAVVWDHFSKGA